MTGERHIDAWENCLQIIGHIIEPQQFATWFKPVRPVSLVESTLTVEVPSDFFREYLETAYIDVIRKALRRVIGAGARLMYRTRPVQNQPAITVPAAQHAVPMNKSINLPLQPSENPGPFVYPGLKKVQVNPRLNPTYCFENLVMGECNRMGIAMGRDIAMAPGKTPYNPLFIFGGSGMGKTHLAQAIGIAIHEKFPELVVLYVTGNEFKTQYVHAVNVQNKQTDFLAFYMRMDVLIMDDIQDLVGPGSQNALFNIFNHLHQNGKQLIFTSDRSPADLKVFEARMLSRFKWGLSVELRKPDYNTRLQMLRSRCEREGVQIGEDVLAYLAGRVQTSFRELEGVLISVIAHATVSHGGNMLELAVGITEKLVGEDAPGLSIGKVQDTVCDYFNISREQLVAKTRRRQIVQARQIAMYLCRNYINNCSLASIGAEIGGKDHATVLHACSIVGDLMATDRVFKKYVTDIESLLAVEA